MKYKILANLLIIPFTMLSCYIDSPELRLIFLSIGLILLINLNEYKQNGRKTKRNN